MDVFKWRKEESIISAFFMSFLICPKALFSPLTTASPTTREKRRLEENLVHSSICQSFLAWRKRMLIVALFLLALSTIPKLAGLMNKDYFGDEIYYSHSCNKCSKLGIAAQISQDVASALILIGAAGGIFFWTNFRLSKRILLYGWGGAIVFGFWPFMIPASYLRNHINGGIKGIVDEYSDRIQYGFLNTVSSLPMFLAISGGIRSGAKRVHKSTPSPFSGTMILFGAIFSIILPFSILTMLVQVLGNALLLLGFFFQMVDPILSLVFSARFEKGEGRIVGLVGLVFKLIGLGLLIVWVIMTLRELDNELGEDGIDEILFGGSRYTFLASKLIAFLANTFFLTVMWTDVIIFASILQHYWGDINGLQFLYNNGWSSADLKRNSDKQLSALSKLIS